MVFNSQLPSLFSKSSNQATSTVKVADSTPEARPSGIEQFMPFVFILVIVYFLFIRPQQKRAKKHLDFVSNIKVGDSVLTSSGILGKVDGLTEQYIILWIADNVKIRVLRSHISSLSQTHKEKQDSSKKSSVVKS